MSKKKRRQKAAPSRRKAQQSSGSLVIPAIVGIVLVAVIIAVLVSFENRGTASSAASIPTALAHPTDPIPYPDVPRISVSDTEKRLAAGKALIVDVRSAVSYQESHIAGALSLPEPDVEARIDELPRDVDLILYCT